MRIRKNASKILGSASTLIFSSCSDLPSPSDINNVNSCHVSSSSSSALSICELNCSPWDLNLVDSNNFNSVQAPKEDKHCIKTIETAPEISGCSIHGKNKKVEEIRYCTKRGKGWDCRKLAEHTHSFCKFHLEKLRASRKINRTTNISKYGAIHKKPAKLQVPSEYNSYYYYSGFGPWRGREGVGAYVEIKEEAVASIGKNKIDDDKVIGEKKAEAGITYCKKTDGKKWHCKRPAQLPYSALCSHHLAQSQSYNSSYSKSGVRSKIKSATKKAVEDLKLRKDESEADEVGTVDVAGDDEYGSYDTYDCEGENIGDDAEENEHVNEVEVKKRRKPVKARSLKSLL